MYAIVEIAGQQFKVEENKYIYTHRLEANEGDAVEFDNVLLVDNDSTVEVGAPKVEGAKVTGKILGHVRGEKVIVFKKKRRKGYKVKNGHRQHFTKVLIEGISK
ncbi:50S ribosomal protein L21 [Algivirga pacifica]|uniref:Large ribosomal subunit protein bL21 n=1 Tax=Algivirga pacifica TaxID=1162670 RepID=A0ABP9D9L3_9BACT